MAKKSFILHKDSLDVLDELTDEQAGKLFKAIYCYEKTGEVLLDGLLKVAFIPFKNQLDRDKEKYESICARNKENADKRWNEQKVPVDTKSTSRMRPHTSGYENVPKHTHSDNDSKKDSKKDSDKEIYKQVVDYLNQKAGTKYKHTSKATRELINGRVADGFDLDDFKKAIDNKVADWASDEKMCKFLRPETLFGKSKFEAYVNEVGKKSGKYGGKTFEEFKALSDDEKKKIIFGDFYQ